jgi:hypothetical protein
VAQAKCKTRGCFGTAVTAAGHCARCAKPKEMKNYSSQNRPKTNAPHLGVEIECKASDRRFLNAIFAQKSAPRHDGSLGDYGCEFKVCAPTSSAINHASGLAERLVAAGAIVDSDCGLHVHIDRRRVSHRRVDEFYVWIRDGLRDWIKSLMPASRQANRYCMWTNYRECNAAPQDHYHWLHATDYGTLELRCHPGTLNPHKLRGWLSACADLQKLLYSGAEFPVVTHSVTDRRPTAEILETVFPTDAAREYLLARHKFGGRLPSYSVSSPAGPVEEVEN